MLALIAGTGDLPATLAAALPSRPLICSIAGSVPKSVEPDLVFRIEHLGSLLQDLTAKGISEVCFCGGIARPNLDPGQLDAATLPLVPIVMEALQQGDDGALRAAIRIFQSAGFDVRAAHDIAPELLLDAGVATQTQPYAEAAQDASIGDQVLIDMGAADLGQACVIREMDVVAREDDAGTDAMLQALPEAPETRLGMLFKAPKPEQDRRVDLPTIGPLTVAGAARAGLAGLTIEAGGVIVLEKDRVISELDRQGMFLWVRHRDKGTE